MVAFISREVADDSEFRVVLERAGWEVEGRSLVQLTPLSVSKIPPAEWWFFTSKNAVQFFLPGKNIPPLLRIGAIGPATADAIDRYIFRTPDFIGNGDPEATAKAFFTVAKKSRVLFPGAVNAQPGIRAHLGESIECILLNVYDNLPVNNPPEMTAARALVFTSPLNAKAYFSVYPYVFGQKVVAIGGTTAAALAELGIPEVVVAKEPDERALAEAVLGSC